MVLPGDKPLLIIDHHVGGEHIPKGGLALKCCARFAQLGLRVQGRHFNAELFNLLIGDAGHATASDQGVAFLIFGIYQPEYAVANTAYHRRAFARNKPR